jgi:hypothetical protein
MRHDRAPIALALLGVGLAANAVLGPLLLNAIRFHVSHGAETQLLGGEIVSLAIAAPLALLACVLWLRGRRFGPLLAAGPALYALYNSVTFIAGGEYSRYAGTSERAFPLYLALIVLGWFVALRVWAELTGIRLPAQAAGARRALGALLLLTGGVFALAWLGSIAPVVLGGTPSRQYLDDPALFWIIRTLDLGFVIPATLVAGVGLLRDAAWAARLGVIVSVFATLYVAAVAAMAVAMQLRHDPSASPVLLVVATLLALALAGALARILPATLREESATRDRATRSRQAA